MSRLSGAGAPAANSATTNRRGVPVDLGTRVHRPSTSAATRGVSGLACPKRAEPAEGLLPSASRPIPRTADDLVHLLHVCAAPRVTRPVSPATAPAYSIGPVAQALPKNAELAAQFDLLADLMELEGATRSGSRAYRKAAARIRETRAPSRSSRSTGAPRSCRGSARRSRRRSSRRSRTARSHALTKRKAEVPPEVAIVHAPARARAEDGAAALAGARDHHRRRPARRGRGAASCAGWPGSARSRRRRSSPRSPSRRRPRGRSARCSGRRCRSCAPSRPSVAAHPAAVEVSIAGSARRFRETVRDLDLIATATDARALLDAFCALPWVVEVAAQGRHEGDGRRARTACASTCASSRRSRYGNLLQHFTGSKDHNVALREAAVRRGLSVSEYGIAEVETGEVHAFATEEEVYALPRLRVDPARAARERRRARGGAQRGAAEARRARRPARRPAHAHDLVGRQGHARGDGRPGDREGLRRTTRSATTPTGCATAGSSSSTRRSTR